MPYTHKPYTSPFCKQVQQIDIDIYIVLCMIDAAQQWENACFITQFNATSPSSPCPSLPLSFAIVCGASVAQQWQKHLHFIDKVKEDWMCFGRIIYLNAPQSMQYLESKDTHKFASTRERYFSERHDFPSDKGQRLTNWSLSKHCWIN